MIHQPLARVVKLEYRSIGPNLTQDALRVHLRGPDAEMAYHQFPNKDYSVENPALQFMALYGYRPSMFDDRGRLDAEADDHQLVMVTEKGPDDGGKWTIAAAAMENGREALENADWFQSVVDEAREEQQGAIGEEGDDGGGGDENDLYVEVQ